LFERLGGMATVEAVVHDLYERLVVDPAVRHHFDPARLPALEAAQVRTFAAALGGPVDPEPVDLLAAHAEVDITQQQADATFAHLEEALAAAGADRDLARQVVAVIGRLWWSRTW
jgi:truncated hemoglobin YjbI